MIKPHSPICFFVLKKYIFLLLFTLSFLRLFPQEIKFKSIGIDDGLSINFVQCILQDHNGFMWFGTQDGLNRYDGYEMKVFRNKNDELHSVSNNSINCLYEAADGRILIGTNDGGLDVFNPRNNLFSHFSSDKGKARLSNNTVRCITQSKTGLVWVGTENGLNALDLNSGTIKVYSNTDKKAMLPDDKIYSVAEAEDGTLWVGTFYKGLVSFDPKSGRSNVFPVPALLSVKGNLTLNENRSRVYALHLSSGNRLYVGTDGGLGIFNTKEKKWENFIVFGDPKNEQASLLNRIWGISEDKQGVLWIASYGGGLIRYEANGIYEIYTQNERDFYSLKSNQIVCVLTDAQDNVWAGTQSTGINVFFRALNKFQHYKHNEFNPNSLNNDHVFALMCDHEGKVWVGTDGGGVNVLDRKTGSFNHTFNEILRKTGITNLSILSLLEDSRNEIWVGTWGSGLVRYNPATKKTKDYLSTTTWGTAVTKILEASDKTIWVATYGDGIFRINPETGETLHFDETNGLSSNNVFALHIDKEGKLWVGTEGGGIWITDLKNTSRDSSRKFETLQKKEGKGGLSSNTVYDIYQDKEGVIWCGTSNGLDKIIPGKTEVTCFYEKDGLPNSTVYGIMQDKEKNLWLTTNKGISRFNPAALVQQKSESGKRSEVFRNYDKKDGLQGLEFNSGSFYVSKEGDMFVGGENGFNIFNPGMIRDNPHHPQVYISSFKRFGKEVEFDTSIVNKKYIELSYKDNFFSFDFVALDYLEPSKNKFTYMLEGVDEDWSEPSTIRYASYTQLEGGEYVFKVKASNNDGVWNPEPTELHIHIVPPWWKTKLFYTLSVILGIVAILAFIRIRTAAVTKENRILEQKVAERTFELAQKNKDITSSIEYAKRIQEALLPSRDLIFSHFRDAFILYKPKDIVSGDFYWFGEKNGLKILAVVDCTGHGVPGAFMSMIGHNLLNQIIMENGITDPAAVLDALNKGVQAALKQGVNTINTNDGMDISLIAVNTQLSELKFSGANRNALVVQANGDCEKIEGNKFPIGGAQLDYERNFTTHHKTMKKGETIYLFSDGYADQFGGEKGKKFMVKRFHEYLSSIQSYSLSDQGKLLNEKIETWRGSYEQVDDILVAGIRF